MGELFKRVIYNTFFPFVESQGALPDRQYGFRKVRSTTEAIKLGTSLPENTIHGEDKNSKHCVLVTPNVKNAFNSANCNLIRKFMATIGIPTYLAAIVEAYL